MTTLVLALVTTKRSQNPRTITNTTSTHLPLLAAFKKRLGCFPPPTSLTIGTQMTETLTKNPRFTEEKWTVKPNGCWEWNGSRGRGGYGVFWDGKNVKAHRYALAMATGGVMPPSDIQACHKCDNPPCVNPDHLFWGKQADNSRDMALKGRAPAGRPQIVPDSELSKIQHRHAGGKSMRSIGREYGVSGAAIHHIVHNKRRAQSN